MYRLGIVLAALVLCRTLLCGAYSQSELTSKPELRVLSDEATKVISKLRTFNSINGLKFAGADRFQPVEGEFTDVDYDGPTVILDSNDHEFNFNPDGKLTHYSSLKFHKECTTIEPTTKASYKPKWSLDQALTIGRGYLQLLYDTSSIILSRPKVLYHPPEADMGDAARVYPGFWTITWVRTDGDGHDFECDRATMRISELWGLTDFSANLTLPYLTQSGVPLSRQAAIKIAKASRPSFEMSPDEATSYTLMGTCLEIVQPNFQRGSTGRLAWIVFLHPVKRKREPNTDQEVTVDAYNGNVIGGTLKENYTSATEW